ncbi:MAG: hypothetical protein AAGC67_09535 [Myxococcota bacterium]
MFDRSRHFLFVGILLAALTGAGCGGPEGAVLLVDAEFNPAGASNANGQISETVGVAQTFTVLNNGKFERFWVLLSQGASPDTGVVRITVRPVAGGVPNASPASSIINPIDVDTSTLPALGTESFTMFDVGSDPGRVVATGEMYAIVVEFVSRTGVDTQHIARFLGIDGSGGDPYTDGSAATDTGTGYVVSATSDDYIFRTFVLEP